MQPITQAFTSEAIEADDMSYRKALSKVAKTLETMHGANMFHGNLKSENILVDRSGDGQVKVVTIATAMSGQNSRDYQVTSHSIPNWITPEIVNENIYEGPRAKDDVWAFGILAYELSTCENEKTPFSTLQSLVDPDEA